MLARIWVLAIAFAGAVAPATALTFQQFVLCVGPAGQGLVCQLDPGVYPVSATIQIGRSNITIKGTIVSSPADTVLQRAPGFTANVLLDLVPPLNQPALQSISIRDLTIDGNRSQNLAAFNTYSPELAIFTTRSLLIANCNFINSPFYSLAVYGTGAAGLVINKSTFTNSFGGFWSGPIGNNSATYTACPHDQLADNVVLTGSRFQSFDTNALYWDVMNGQLIGNYFTESYTYAIGGYFPGGGQIDLGPCANNIAVVGNTFEGGTRPPGAGNTQGMEFHGTYITAVNNAVTDNWQDGVSIDDAANVFLANWDTTKTIAGNGSAGVAISQGNEPGTYDSQRKVDFITIDSTIILNNHASGIWANDAVLPVNHLRITNNCVSGNGDPQISLSDLGPDVVVSNNIVSGCPAK